MTGSISACTQILVVLYAYIRPDMAQSFHISLSKTLAPRLNDKLTNAEILMLVCLELVAEMDRIRLLRAIT